MASSFNHTTLLIIIFHLTLVSTFSKTSLAGFSEEVADGIALHRVEKTTHLHFFFHDIIGGKNPTAVKVAGADDSSKGFGDTYVVDDPLTETQDRNSKLVGKAQGMYAIASQTLPALLMVINYEFTEGKYNGSSISILGRNPVFNDVREFAIVGGCGLFRYARGYALAHTVWADPKTLDATVEYNVYVIHS